MNKKNYRAVATRSAIFLSLSWSAVQANAQSSVTLYGIVEDGIIYTNNQKGASAVQATTGQTNTSRWGFVGNEDLGAGYKAIFTLEAGFDTSTGKAGQGGLAFGRTASVGIATPYGQVTAGRQYEPLSEYLGPLGSAIRWAGWLGAHPGDVDNLQSTIRLNNSLQYTSRRYHGLSFRAAFAPGGVAGSMGRQRSYSAGAGYSQGPLTVGVAYLNIHDPAIVGYGGTILPGQAGFTSPVSSPIYSGYASASTLQVMGVGASYRLQKLTVGAVVTSTRYEDILRTTSTPHTGTAQIDNFEINSKYQLVPSTFLAAAFIYTKAESAKYLQWNVGIDYSFSRRTDLYLQGVWQRASGIDSTGQQAVADITSLTASSTNNQVAARVNLRHRF